jgi:lauroyl/myristoyl acyltransferase
VTLHSSALLGGTLDVVEKPRRYKRRLASASHLKDLAVPWLVRFLRSAPRPLALVPVGVVLALARLMYVLPRNPLRRASHDMAAICRAHGKDIAPKTLYRDFLANTRAMAALVLRLYRNGWREVIEDVQFPPDDVARIQALVDEYGGVAVAVPHNLGSTFSGIRFDKAFSSVLLSKNSASVERTRIALDFFERLDAQVLMVRDGSAVQISRSLIKLLRSKKVVAITVDRLAGPKDGIAAEMFGRTVWLPAWATRIPSKIGAPIVPAYVRSAGGQLHGVFGPAVVTDDPNAAAAAIAAFLEGQIIDDPASWAFLAEKRWGRVLAEAAVNPGR